MSDIDFADVSDDELFSFNYLLDNGLGGPKSIKKRNAPYKNKYQERTRQRAEEAATNIIRHRIQDNERRYPEIFAVVRGRDFLHWYEAVMDRPWNPEYESAIDEMRFRVIQAIEREQDKMIGEAERLALRDELLGELAPLKRRRLLMKLATPRWADFQKIAEIYRERDRLTEETGIQHHVDHIIPIQGKFVCGLHCEFNLRAIPASENLKKSNRTLDTE